MAWRVAMVTLVTWMTSFAYAGVESTARAVAPPFLREFFWWMNPGYGPWVGWMTSFLIGTYACLYVMSRASRFRTYRYLTVNTGHFHSGGKMYYRSERDGPLYRVDLKKAKGIDMAGSLVSPEYEYFPVGGSFLGFSESTLLGTHPVKRISANELPQGLVILFDAETVAGIGWRFGNSLVTARHLADLATELWVQGSNARVRVNTLFSVPPRDRFEFTGADIASAELPQSTWSQIGSKQIKPGQLSNKASGRVRVYGADQEGVYESYGDLVVNATEQKARGTISYKVSTLPGFSGSPVILRNSTGGTSIVGMHICGDYNKRGMNHGACIAALSLHLTGTISGGTKLTLEKVLNESSLQGDKQDYFDQWDELEDFVIDENPDGIKDLYHNDKMWDKEDRDVRGKIRGFDDEGGSGSDGDFNEAANKIPRSARPSEMEAPKEVDPHAFVNNDYLAPPSETDVQRIGRQVAARDDTEEGRLTKAYRASVESFAPQYAPVMTGLLKGEIPWSSTASSPAYFPQQLVKKCDATPDDIQRLFRKLFEGDHSALIEAAGFTYASLVDNPKSSIVDPMMEFRHYRDHTRALIMSNKKTDQILPAGDGKAFFRHIGMADGANRKKARREPLKLNPEETAFLESIGVTGMYALPPNDENAVRRSMTVQAAKQTTTRGLPMMEFMTDAWVMSMKMNAGTIPDLKYGESAVEQIFAGFDDTSAGWTRRYRNHTKKGWVKKHAVQLCQLGFGRLLARASCLDSLPSMTPEEMVHLGLRDPVELFVKEEGHTEKKVRTETWRLICNISLGDCMVQAYLNHGMNKQQIRDYQSGAVVSHTCGMGHHDEGIQRLGSHIENLFPNGRVVSTDASGWDMSVSRDAIMADATNRCLRVFQSLKEEQAVGTAMAIMADKLCTSCHVFTSGRDLWSVDVYGITASGLPDTTTQNSYMRGLGAFLAGTGSAMTAGDDLLSSSPLDEDALKRQGTITKDGLEIANWKLGETIPFTSHGLKRSATGKWTAEFQNVSKSLHKLMLENRDEGNAPAADQLGGVAFAMRHSDVQLEQLSDLCKFKGWTFPEKSEWSWNGDLCG